MRQRVPFPWIAKLIVPRSCWTLFCHLFCHDIRQQHLDLNFFPWNYLALHSQKSKHKLIERPNHPRYEFNHVFPLHMPSVPFFDANFFNAQWAHQGVHHQFATAIVRIRIQNIFAFPGLRHGELSRCLGKWGVEWDICWWLYTQSWTNQDAVLCVRTHFVLSKHESVSLSGLSSQRGWSATRLLRTNFDTFSESAAESFIQFEADKISKGGLISWQCNTLDLSIHMIG